MVLLCHLKPEVIEAARTLILEDFKLENYMKIFDQEISRGLDAETYEEASVKSIITHVNKLPSGNEEGQFLGLDFSGPQLKVMVVKLENRECTITQKIYDIKDKYKKGKSEKGDSVLFLPEPTSCHNLVQHILQQTRLKLDQPPNRYQRHSIVMMRTHALPHLVSMTSKKQPERSTELFDKIAKCIADFLSGVKLKMFRIPLGVTFGFPIEQTSLQDCKLLRWSKGFDCNDLVGQNIFLKLKQSIRKFPELKRVYVIGILNDSVSAVLACAWQDPSCMIGVAIGSGASCCYAEKVYRVTKYETDSYAIRDIYINLESACLGEDGCLDEYLSDYDRQLDEDSNNPGKTINDKLISTDYFGELARLVLLKCLQDNIILNGVISNKLLEKNSLNVNHLARIESDPDTSHDNCREVLAEFDYPYATDEDCFQVQFICRCVSRRSANLVAAQLATIINRIKAPTVTIAADGDLIKAYPNYKWYLERKLRQLKNPECEFQIRETGESGLGPAVMAAVFGKEIMDRDEKLRKLPGFPMEKCHFHKKGKCANPNCEPGQPCEAPEPSPLQTPVVTSDDDLSPCTCFKEKQGCGACRGYDRIDDTLHDDC